MNALRKILGKAGLVYVLLTVVLLVAPSVPVPVSAQEPNPNGKTYLPLVIQEGNDNLTSVATAGNPDVWCGKCVNVDPNTHQCVGVEREFYDPDNPTNCFCNPNNGQPPDYGNCTWWVLSQRPDLESSTIVDQWNQYNSGWDWQPTNWPGYAERSGYWVDDTPREGAIAVFNAGAQGAGPLGHVAYVTGVADDPPTNHSWFSVTEMNCGSVDRLERDNPYYADGGVGVNFIYAPGVYLCADANGTGKCRRFAEQSDYLRGVTEPGGVTSTYLDFEDLARQGLYWNNATSSVYVSGNYWAILWENELAGGTARRGWGGWWLGVGPKGNSLSWSDHIDNLYDHPAPIFNDRTSAIFVWKKGDPQIPAANLSNADGAPKEGVYMCPDGWFRNGDPENPMYCYNFPVDAGTSCTRYDIWWWGNGATSFWILGDYEVWVRGINDWSKNETFGVNDAELWQPSPGNRIFNDDIGTFEVRRKGAGQAQALGTDGTEFKITENPAASTQQTTQQMTAADTTQGTACTYSPPPCSYTPGQGSSRGSLFLDAYNRNGGAGKLGCARNGAHWWGSVVAQDFTGSSSFGEAIIIQDESHDNPPFSISAYVVHGDIWVTYRNMGGPASWLGVPTSDEFVNATGFPQSNFRNGYITWNGGNWQAYCPYQPGQGSSRQQLFLNAYNRNGGMAKLGCATSGAYWWGPVVAQNFTGSPGYDEAVIFQDEPHDNPPMTVPAYVVHGEIWRTYRQMGGPASWLGVPTSDEFVNGQGYPQSNFTGGYITFNGSSWQAYYSSPVYHSFQSFNYPNEYIRHRNSLGEKTPVTSELDRKDATFRMVPGLADPTCVSLEARNYPGYFLRHQDSRVKLQPSDGNQLFKADATFCVRPGLADPNVISFESKNYPGRYLRHRGGQLWVEAGTDALFRADASWRIDSPLWTGETYLSFQSFNYPDRYIRHRNALGEATPIVSDLDKKDATFRVIPGLADPNCVSLESRNYPGHYLRHQDSRVKLAPQDDTQLFRDDATFCVKLGLADPYAVSFESKNFPGRYLRHRGGQLWVEAGDGSDLYRKDATWRMVAPFWS